MSPFIFIIFLYMHINWKRICHKIVKRVSPLAEHAIGTFAIIPLVLYPSDYFDVTGE